MRILLVEDSDLVQKALLRLIRSVHTPETVEKICGTPKDTFLKVAEIVTSTGNAQRCGTIMYALGWTQHSIGVQMIRTAAMLQLLLGNVGRPGGGVNALRGHSNIQGATDTAGVFDILPGYLKTPQSQWQTLKEYNDANVPKALGPSMNYWQNYPKFMVSVLKAAYGKAATKENEFGYAWLPKVDGNYSWMYIFDDMYRGNAQRAGGQEPGPEGLMTFGMNPVGIGPNSPKMIAAHSKLKWLVVVENHEVETATFWKAPKEYGGAGSVARSRPRCSSCRPRTSPRRTGLHQFRALDPVEVEGRGSARADQDGPGNPRAHLPRGPRPLPQGGRRAARGGPERRLGLHEPRCARPRRSASRSSTARRWRTSPIRRTKTKVLKTAGQQLDGFGQLQDDGSTMCGNWLMSGVYTEAGNMAQRRNSTDDPSGLGMYHNWTFSWPANRRVMYNRASADAEGKPWDPTRVGHQVERREVGRRRPRHEAGRSARDVRRLHHAAGGRAGSSSLP